MAAFGTHAIISKSKVPIYLKKREFSQCVLPVITYEYVASTLEKDIRKLQVTLRCIEAIMLAITKKDYKEIDLIHRMKTLT